MASDAARRAAEALLRSTGGRSVSLRIPAPAAAGSVSEQLGLATPEFQDVELSPVVFRKARPGAQKAGERWELMVSANAVDSVLGGTGATDASELFAGAAGVLVDDRLMEIELVSSSDMDGAPYVYRLVVRVPQAKTI
jgi:hypothetical protein